MIYIDSFKNGSIKSNLAAIFVVAKLILAATIALVVTALVSYSGGVYAAGTVPKSSKNMPFLDSSLNILSHLVNMTENPRFAWLLSQSMDLTRQPCQNFYAYVCGRHHVTQVDPLSELVARNVSSRIRNEFLKFKVTSADKTAMGKAVAFFASCMSRAEGERREDSRNALVNFMKQNALTFEMSKARGLDLLDELFRFLLDYNLQLVFRLYVDAWPQRGESVRSVRVIASDDFETWAKLRTTYVLENKYEGLVKQVLSATGIRDDNYVGSLTRDIIKIENTVMKIWENQTYSGSNRTPRSQKWESSLQRHSKGAFAEGYALYLKSDIPEFLNTVLIQLNRTERTLYLSWLVARHLVSLSGLVTADHWKRSQEFCFDKTYALFKNAVVAPYLFHAASNATLTDVRNMVELIAEEVRVSIEDSSWLKPDIKTKLREKIAAVKWKMGFPKGLASWDGVDTFYSGYPAPRGSFLETYMATSQAYALQQLSLRPYWSSDFANANLESDRPSVSYGGPNTISIPAASVVSPFFDTRGQAALNYGVLGSIVTRQLMRAFHHDNRKDDGKGSQIKWSESEDSKFMDRWNCRQNLRPLLPNDYAEPTVSVGAQALFRAYKMAAGGQLSSRAPEGLSSDQLFFVSRCYVYCGYRHIDTPHECSVLAQDSREFAWAFDCSQGSPMNPEYKCEVW